MTSRFWCAPIVALLLSAPAFAGSKEEAKAHYVAGLQAAQGKAYALAIGEFLASWELYAHPATARNIARAYEDYGDPRRALVWYKRFQDASPSEAAEVAADVLRLHEQLDPLPAAIAAAPVPAPAPAPSPARAGTATPPPPPKVKLATDRPTDIASEVERVRASIASGRQSAP